MGFYCQDVLPEFLHPDLTYWIGLTDIDVEGTFVWQSDHEVANFTNWEEGEPNNEGGEDYVHLVRQCVTYS